MNKTKLNINVLTAARERISISLAATEKHYICFSGGKDSTVLLHLVIEQVKECKHKGKIGVLFIDLEAQFKDTISHIHECISLYRDLIDVYWYCPQLILRNSTSYKESNWVCWDENKEHQWVRSKPSISKDLIIEGRIVKRIEFEEFVDIFSSHYSKGASTTCFIGIRAEESINRLFATSINKDFPWITVNKNIQKSYPIYDWTVYDVWKFTISSGMPYNEIYSKMTQAGVPLVNQRICHPYGDEQKKGLWLYHVLEPETWAKICLRVDGANTENNVMFFDAVKIISTSKDCDKWKKSCVILLESLPLDIKSGFLSNVKRYLQSWKSKGYTKIPDDAPLVLSNKNLAPSWRCVFNSIVSNDFYGKKLGLSPPKTEAYSKFKAIQLKNRVSKGIDFRQKTKKQLTIW